MATTQVLPPDLHLDLGAVVCGYLGAVLALLSPSMTAWVSGWRFLLLLQCSHRQASKQEDRQGTIHNN